MVRQDQVCAISCSDRITKLPKFQIGGFNICKDIKRLCNLEYGGY
jgi:hypothetical protein